MPLEQLGVDGAQPDGAGEPRKREHQAVRARETLRLDGLAEASGLEVERKLLDTEILGLKDIKNDQPIEWYADGAKIEAPANVAVGTYAEVSTTLAWEDVNVTVSVGPGLEVYVDDLRVEGKTAFAVGEHKITVYIKPNYEGTPEITLNGQAIAGDSFTLTADMIDGDNILYVTGVSPADSTIVIDGGNNGGDDGLGLTDILLIILVILIVIMAIMVALRMMRS